jgi:hypothetical protein
MKTQKGGDMKGLSQKEINKQFQEWKNKNPEAWLELKSRDDVLRQELRQKRIKGILAGMLSTLALSAMIFAFSLPFLVMEGYDSWIAVCIRIFAFLIGITGAVTIWGWADSIQK